MADRGEYPVGELDEGPSDDAPSLVEVDHALAELGTMITRPDADRATLLDQIDALNDLRERALVERPAPAFRVAWSTVREGWEAATDDLERREVLCSQLGTLRVRRGERPGGRLPDGTYFDASRIMVEWASLPDLPITWAESDGSDLGQIPSPKEPKRARRR